MNDTASNLPHAQIDPPRARHVQCAICRMSLREDEAWHITLQLLHDANTRPDLTVHFPGGQSRYRAEPQADGSRVGVYEAWACSEAHAQQEANNPQIPTT